MISGPEDNSVSYAALVGGKTFSITLDPKSPVPTKAPKDFTLVQPIQRVDIPDKMTGRYTYIQDPACFMDVWFRHWPWAPNFKASMKQGCLTE
jgi:hypothetical protein